MALGDFGEPITASYAIPGGTAQLFTGGVSIQHSGGELRAGFTFPTLGRPCIAGPEPTMLSEHEAIHFDPGGGDVERLADLIRGALAGRLALSPTAQQDAEVPLILGAVSPVGAPIRHFEVPTPDLADRTLYDVALRADAGGWRRVAPHAVYFKRGWDDFGILHATDMHVSKRIDRFKGLLEMSDRPRAAARVYNHNNRCRGFIRYANYLHAMGLVDVILSTGDQYDYIFEEDDDPAGGGNAAFLRALMLGQAPGPDFLDVEELRVPIFMTAGNHDYRRHAYALIFDLHPEGLGLGADVMTIRNYGSFNLDQDAGRVLQRRLRGEPLPTIPIFWPDLNLTVSQAAEQVAVDTALTAHRQFLADKTSYVVALGAHRVVMIDSGPDTGVLSSAVDGLRQVIGLTSEDEDSFAGGSPNSQGVAESELQLVREALTQTANGGLVIVGIHAPLVNPFKSEYPYFLRETQRPFHPRQPAAWLWRLSGPLHPAQTIESRHPKWFPSAGDAPPPFVVRGDRNDLLDYGVSRGHADDLLQLLAGGATRGADLVLSGHTHYHNEFRLQRLDDGELAFFMDHYTENPVNYYPSRFCSAFTEPLDLPLHFEKTFVEVVPGAAPDATPAAADDADLEFDLHVPPYDDPLNGSADAPAWWEKHRPVLLQTAALGPKNGLPFLNGFRLLAVRSGVIASSHFLSMARLEAHGYQLPFEEAIRPDRPGPPQASWRSVSDGATLPGASITPVPIGTGITAIIADATGAIYACHGSYAKGWSEWGPVSEGSTRPGGSVSAVAIGDRIAVFTADANGGVYTCLGSVDAGWGPWRSVSDGSTTPGGHVTAVATGDRIHVFLADAGGGIFATVGSGAGAWAAWQAVSEGSSTPGAPIAAVAAGGTVTVILADPSGGIYANAGTYETGWGPWKPVSEGATIPGGHVSAALAGSRITLCLADANGGVYLTSGDYFNGWDAWTSASEGRTTPGAAIATTVIKNRIRLLLADPDGGVYASVVPFGGVASAWRNVSEGVTRPGGFVRAAATKDGVTAFLADPTGGIFARLIT